MTPNDLESTINEYVGRRSGDQSPRCEVRSADLWQLDVGFSLVDSEPYRIRSLQPGDGPALHEFASQLGPRSKWLFCPYPWADSQELEAAFGRAIQRTVSGPEHPICFFIAHGRWGTSI